MRRGLFITFEGGEGAGKTTQIRRLAAALGDDCLVTREPGGTPDAEALRNLFIAQSGHDWPSEATLLLMFCARVLHTKNLILPALEQGRTVLCDRYTDSTRVYQGLAGDIGEKNIEAVKRIAIGEIEPDLTFILDIDPEAGLRRASSRGAADSFESKDLAFHRKIREGFLSIADRYPARCVVIDALDREEIIAAKIMEKVRAHVR
jgi:dTMP kinase